MAPLPKKLKVGAYTITVGQDMALLEASSAEGHYAPAAGVINVADDMSPDRTREVLLHEFMHAVWFNTPFRTSHSDEQEEALVTGLTLILLPALRANPKLVEFLLAE